MRSGCHIFLFFFLFSSDLLAQIKIFWEVNFRIVSFEVRVVGGGLSPIRLKNSSAEAS